MQVVQNVSALSVAEYLEGELVSRDRHEYIGGVVYAMAGGSDIHNIINLNLALALKTHLKGKPCKVNMVDVKVHLEISVVDVFYYPDVMVACDPRNTVRISAAFRRC